MAKKIAVLGYKSNRKKRFIQSLLAFLKQKGYAVFFYKKADSIDVDSPKKDTYELYQAGLDYVMLVTGKARYLRSRNPIYCSENSCYFKDYDLFVLEDETQSADILVMVADDLNQIKSSLSFDAVLTDIEKNTKHPHFKKNEELIDWIVEKIK